VLTRLRSSEGGFGLVELIIAMTVLNVGLLALVAALNSGALALSRASRLSTAATLADQQMELYRGLLYGSIALDSASVTTLVASNNDYSCDDAIKVNEVDACGSANRKTQYTITCTSPLSRECSPSQTVTGPDGFGYRVDTYILDEAPAGLAVARNVRIVTIVVRDSTDLARTFVRQESTFDQSTGG
jgi:Tfp pilus assembly protein PilE